MDNEILINSRDKYFLRILDRNDRDMIHDLCIKCNDYYRIVSGKAPDEESVRDILNAVPPGMDRKNKFTFGIFDNAGNLAGLSDVVLNYKTVNEITIGLLLIDPDYRRKHLGKCFVEYIINWGKELDKGNIRLGIAEDNINAVKFWEKLGFKSFDKKEMIISGKLNIVLYYILNIEKRFDCQINLKKPSLGTGDRLKI